LPDAAAKYWMKISEVIKPVQPKTPEQQRVASLQRRVTNANQALKAERHRLLRKQGDGWRQGSIAWASLTQP